MHAELPGKLDEKEIVKRYIKAIDKGLLKVMSKMGISTYQSYCGAQIFDAVGLQGRLRRQVLHRHRDPHRGRRPRRDRRGNRAAATATRSATSPVLQGMLDVGGEYAVPHPRRGPCLDRRRRSRRCSTRCAATRRTSTARSPRSLNEQSERLLTIRGLFRIKTRRGGRPQAGAARRGRAGEGHRQALRHRRDVASARSRARRTPRSPSP